MNKEDNKRKIKIALTLEGRYIEKKQKIEKIETKVEKIENKQAETATEKSKKDTFFKDVESRSEQKISENIVRTFSASRYKTAMV